MNILIAAVGKIRDAWIAEGIAEYEKRLRPYCQLKIQEAAEERMPENFSEAEKARALDKEGERLLKIVPAGHHLFALDLAGRAISSEELAARIERLGVESQSRLAFVIGGTFGLSPAASAAAHERISLSRMTFTHSMARLILAEQLYRAFKIIRGEKYHW